MKSCVFVNSFISDRGEIISKTYPECRQYCVFARTLRELSRRESGDPITYHRGLVYIPYSLCVYYTLYACVRNTIAKEKMNGDNIKC